MKLTMPSSVTRCASEGKEAMLGPADRAIESCTIESSSVLSGAGSGKKGSATMITLLFEE